MTSSASSTSVAFSHRRFLLLVVVLSLFVARTASAQPIAFVNVNLIPMDRELV